MWVILVVNMNKKLNKINLLQPETIDKIAAGEIIERPASIVKELVENSIDAGAKHITVQVRKGGMESVQIVDDGYGMSEEDAKLSVQRHATSKIRESSDLFAIKTLGFRGEALASISAVSLFRLETSQGDDAFAIEVEGGDVKSFGSCARARGTTVTVREIFYNTPARRKFLKSERAELNKIMSTIEEIAMLQHQISFTVWHNDRKLLDLSAADSKTRLLSVLGKEISSQCLSFDSSEKGARVWGFLGHPQIAKSNSRSQYLFVNKRPVSDRGLQYAVKRSYKELMPNDRYPVFVLFVEVDPKFIDVNVHPTKRQVRFSDERLLFNVVYSIVSRALNESSFRASNFSAPEKVSLTPVEQLSKPYTYNEETLSLFREPKTEFNEQNFISAKPMPLGSKTEYAGGSGKTEADSGLQASSFEENIIETQSSSIAPEVSVVYFQLHRLYILSPIKNGLLIVDQHAAHERILYEKALREFNQPSSVSQQLLFPIVMELTSVEFSLVNDTQEYFARLGFDIKQFGGNNVIIEGTPPQVGVNAVKRTIHDMISYLMDTEDTDSSIFERVAKSFACGAAIKAGQDLAQEEMASLIDMLFSAKNPYTCPHGRPTLIRLPLNDISKRFMR